MSLRKKKMPIFKLKAMMGEFIAWSAIKVTEGCYKQCPRFIYRKAKREMTNLFLVRTSHKNLYLGEVESWQTLVNYNSIFSGLPLMLNNNANNDKAKYIPTRKSSFYTTSLS